MSSPLRLVGSSLASAGSWFAGQPAVSFLAPTTGSSFRVEDCDWKTLMRVSREAGNERFLELFRRFPAPGYQIYTAKIVSSICAIPCGLPHFHERLLEAFAHAPEDRRGTLDQLYTAKAIEHLFLCDALNTARGSPEYALLQSSMIPILADQDTPRRIEAFQSLFQDMEARSPDLDLLDISIMAERGLSPKKIAEVINGTRYTAYLNDMRLAQKVVSVSLDLGSFLKDPGEREASWSRFERALWAFVRSGRPLGPSEMFALLETNPSPQIRSLRKAWQDGRFDIEMLPEEDFDALVARWGRVSNCKYGLFQQRTPPHRDRIVIRKIPSVDFSPPEREKRLPRGITERLVTLRHEGDHWRQAVPFPFRSRHDCLAAETMAGLEEYRWRRRNLDDDWGKIARRLGINLPLYLRSMAEIAYY